MPGGSLAIERLSLINLHDPFGRITISDFGGVFTENDRRVLLYSYTGYGWPSPPGQVFFLGNAATVQQVRLRRY